MAEATVFVSPFDQARDVCDGAAAETWEFDHADDGLEGGEGVGCHFGFCRREFAEERGFAGVGESDEASIGDAAEFEVEDATFARGAERVFDGCAVGGGFEIPVSEPVFAAFAEDEFLAVFSEVGDGFEVDAIVTAFEVDRLLDGGGVGAVDDGARRDASDDAFAAFAGFANAGAIFAVFGDEFRVVVVLAEGIGGWVYDEDDIAAVAAVTTVGTAFGDILFAPPRNDAVSAVASFSKYTNMVDEHAAQSLVFWNRSTPMVRK